MSELLKKRQWIDELAEEARLESSYGHVYNAKVLSETAAEVAASLIPPPLEYVTDFTGGPLQPQRPSFDEMGVRTARLWSERSADSKLKVGVAILSNDSHSLVSIGYNGRYPGSKTETRVDPDRQGCSEFLHGEQNAIVRARWEIGEKHSLYSTSEPCHECALLILAARHINRVVYETSYAGDGKRRRGSEILKDAGVEVVQWQG